MPTFRAVTLSQEVDIGADYKTDEDLSSDERRSRRYQQRIQDTGTVMGTPQGRRFMRRLLKVLCTNDPTFDSNAMEQSRRNGRRDVGCELQDFVEREFPEEFISMTRERLRDGE